MTAGNNVISAIKELRVATIIAIGVSTIHIAIALSHAGPVAVPDVSAYLYFQQLIFGGARLTDVPFFPGYGLMLVPFGPLAGQTLHTMALVTNGVFAGFIVVLAAVFVRRLGGSTKLASYGGVLAAVHPAVVLQGVPAHAATGQVALDWVAEELLESGHGGEDKEQHAGVLELMEFIQL